jgi:hypothetical protein
MTLNKRNGHTCPRLRGLMNLYRFAVVFHAVTEFASWLIVGHGSEQFEGALSLALSR